MNFTDFFKKTGRFFQHKPVVLLFIMLLLGAAAFTDFRFTGNNRYTMVFYSIKDEIPVIEDRMIPPAEAGTKTPEDAITKYVSEVLLGPVTLDIAPLFPKGTRLKSLFCRNNEVFINLSSEAAFPPSEGIQDVKKNLSVLVSGIRRNFAYIKNIKLFINGNEVFF